MDKQIITELSFLSCSMFWTALSAIATIAMALATFITLRQNRKQLDEMKRQWEESKKPIVEPSLVIPPYTLAEASLGIQLKNIGGSVAEIQSIHIDDSFIQSFENKEIEDFAKFVCSQRYHIAPNESICLTLFDVRKKGEYYILYGNRLSLGDYYKIVNILLNFKVRVICDYGVDRADVVFTNYDRSYYIRTIQQELSDISMHLSEIKSSIDSK